MIIMTPLLASPLRDLSPPTSFWRQTAAPETFAQARSASRPGKKYTQLSRSASARKAAASNSGVSARNKYRPALTAAFKSP
jgi:hypothetical protein